MNRPRDGGSPARAAGDRPRARHRSLDGWHRLPPLRAVLAGGTAVVVLGALLASCDGGPADDDARARERSRSDGRSGPKAVPVTRETLEVVTTVPATVRAGPEVDVTAPSAGTVERIDADGVVIRTRGSRDEAAGDDGRDDDRGRGGSTTRARVKVDFPSGLSIVEELVAVGRRVPANYPLARGRVEGFAMVALLDRQSLHKVYDPPLSARAQISEGPGPFDCPLANSVPSADAQPALPRAESGTGTSDTTGGKGGTGGTGGSGDPGDGPGGDPDGGADAYDAPAAESAADARGGPAAGGGRNSGMRLVCVVPEDTRVFAGMVGVMAIRTASVKDALLLPVEAVAGDSSRGEVTVVEPNGGLDNRTVRLGATDGSRVELISGVREGERVRVPGPDLAGAT
ncbi:efflux RND transporter periplasmic adaptor subunit, partial [Streptomyces sp. P38-E01]|nr:efflux RND transporter periplasmic adaptor subunit [Streptomyces tardus]